MKKYFKYLFVTLLITFIPTIANAQSIGCRASASTVTVGSTFTVTFYASGDDMSSWQGRLDADTSKVSVVSGTTSTWFKAGPNLSETWTFKANSIGTARIGQQEVVAVFANLEKSTSANSCTVNIVAANSSNSSSSNNRSNNNSNRSNNANKSGNNNLKSLSINDVIISPEFDKDKLEYSAVVEGTQERININAEAEDSKASISGAGEKDLIEGLNELTVSVTAENGNIKEYKISITRKEKNPIEVIVGKKNYTVLKKETELEVPEGFTKTNIVMDGQDVVAYSNEYTAYILVVLVDEDGNADFYIYDKKEDSYTEYVEFESKNIKLMLMEPKAKDVPYNYKKVTFPVDGKVVNGYYLEYKSDFRLVYGMNMANGDVDFYLYDMEQKTFQRFYNVQVETYIDLVKKFKYLSLGIGTVTFILFIIVIALLAKIGNLKKKLKNSNKEEKSITREQRYRLKDETTKEIVDDSKTKKMPELKEEKVDKKSLKAENRKKQKEEKQKAKEAKRLEKEKKKQERKALKEEKVNKESKKELKRLQKEEDKKRKEEANNFLK